MMSIRWLPIFLALKVIVDSQSLTVENGYKFEANNSMESSVEIGDDVEDDQNEDVIIITGSGPVQGYVHKDIKWFYDIPYGTFSPVNPFEEPSPPEPWLNVHNESEHKSRCPQIGYTDTLIGNTECLTLSIMTPLTAVNADVLFHIHDGSFNTGSGNPSIYGPEYIVPKGIILVLPNYRLGPLGFLCIQNATMPGNAALKDLALALKWVKENIAAFGGNALNIVVSGDGNAGALAGYLALSPTSRSYVSKVIAESGFVLSHWALDRDPSINVGILLDKIRTPIEPVVSKSSKQEYSNMGLLIAAAKNMKFAPCVENGSDSFITETPWKMLNGLKTNISYMIGTTNHAGMREALQHTELSLTELNDDFGLIFPNDLDFKHNDTRSHIGNKIKVQYFGDEKLTLDKVEDLSFCYTDVSYLGPMIRAARPLVIAGASVFFYEFAFVGGLNQEIDSSAKIHGASIGDVGRYIFSREGNIPADGTKEKYMVDIVTELWGTFIHTGQPTAEGIEWHRLEQTTEVNENWLLIGSEVKPQKGLHVDRLKLWTEIYDTYFIEHNCAFGTTPYFYSFMLTIFFVICISKFLV